MVTRCSRGTAGLLPLPGALHFVQAERVAAIYNHYHAWMDLNGLRFDDSTSEEGPDFGIENTDSTLLSLPTVG